MHKYSPRIVSRQAADGPAVAEIGENGAMATPQEIVRLKITLDDVKPTLMRRIEVPVSIPLDTLHEMIQSIMPWENSHLHQFYLRIIDGPRWAPPYPFDDDFGTWHREARLDTDVARRRLC